MHITNKKEIQNTVQDMINGVLYLLDTGIPPEQIQLLMKATEEKCESIGIVWPPAHFEGREVPGFEGVTSFTQAMAISFDKIARGEGELMIENMRKAVPPGFPGTCE